MVSDAGGFKPIGKPDFGRAEAPKQAAAQAQDAPATPVQNQQKPPKDIQDVKSYLGGDLGKQLNVDFDVMSAIKAMDVATSPKASDADKARAMMEFGTLVEGMDKDQLLLVAQKLTDRMANTDGKDEMLNAMLQRVFEEVGERNAENDPIYKLLDKLKDKPLPFEPGNIKPVPMPIYEPPEDGIKPVPMPNLDLTPKDGIKPVPMPVYPGVGGDIDPGFGIPTPGNDVDPGFSIDPNDMFKKPDKQLEQAKNIVNDIMNLRMQKRPTQAEVAKKVLEFSKTIDKMSDEQLLALASFIGDQMANTDIADDTLGVLMTEVLKRMDKPSFPKFPPGVLDKPIPPMPQWPKFPFDPPPFKELPINPNFRDYMQLLENKV